MGAVFACNAYIDAAAPWALRKTDPKRMAEVLGTLVVAVRELAEAVKPVIPASAEKLIALIDGGKDGAPIAQPMPDLPASRARGGGRSGGMKLIDSHCHLNYAGLAERQEEVLANARARGIAGFLNISTRQSEWGEVVGAAERNDDVWASIGVHPHEADAHPDLGAAALVGGRCASPRHRHRRMRARLLLRQVRPGGAARAVPGAYRGGASDGAAVGGPHARGRG